MKLTGSYADSVPTEFEHSYDLNKYDPSFDVCLILTVYEKQWQQPKEAVLSLLVLIADSIENDHGNHSISPCRLISSRMSRSPYLNVASSTERLSQQRFLNLYTAIN